MRRLIPYIVIILAVLAVFARTVGFSYIGLDDAAYTFRNPFVAGGFTICNAVEAFSNLRHGGIWMPLTYISYMADVSVCKAIGFPLIGWLHLTNVWIHLLNAVLCFVFAKRLSKYVEGKTFIIGPLIFSIIVWAVHPLRVEPVAWIAARKELLWTFFALLGVLSWERGRYVPAYICCALSCLSKPTAVCIPLIFIICDCFFGKLAIISWRKVLMRYMPVLLMSVITAIIAAYSQTHVAGQTETELFALPLFHRLINAMSAIGYYIKAFFLPYGLHIDCRSVVGIIPIDGVWNLVTLGICALLCFGALLRAHIRRSLGIGSSRILIFSMSWFIISLFPTLGIIGNFGVEAHADRFAYLPMMAISFLLMRMSLSTTVKMLIIAGILSLSWIQTGYWKDNATAYARALECDESHPRAMVHVADFKCSRRRDFDSGIELYKKALELEGSVPKGGFNVSDVRARLAYALVSRGRYNDYREVISLGGEVLKDFSLDRRGMMLDALGTAFMQEGDFKLAARLFQASLDAPDRFWPKASTRQKLESCIKNRR